MLKSLKTTLKAFPVITVVAVSLCFITTELFDLLLGIRLPEQSIVAAMRYVITHAFDSMQNFLNCASALAQVLVLVPVVEEILFRWLLFMLPLRLVGKRHAAEGGAAHTAAASAPSASARIAVCIAVLSAAAFSAAHYIQMPWPNNAFIALFFFGLAQCWLYRKTDYLWCPALNHALFNTANLVLMFIVSS